MTWKQTGPRCTTSRRNARTSLKNWPPCTINWAARTNSDFWPGPEFNNWGGRLNPPPAHEAEIVAEAESLKHGRVAEYFALVTLIAHPFPDALPQFFRVCCDASDPRRGYAFHAGPQSRHRVLQPDARDTCGRPPRRFCQSEPSSPTSRNNPFHRGHRLCRYESCT